MERATERAEREGYPPTGYRQMVRERGSHLEAAHSLLEAPATQVHSGLWTLGWMRMLECSVEHHATLDEFRDLFNDRERARARERLRHVRQELEAGHAPKPGDVSSRFSD